MSSSFKQQKIEKLHQNDKIIPAQSIFYPPSAEKDTQQSPMVDAQSSLKGGFVLSEVEDEEEKVSYNISEDKKKKKD